MSGREGELKEYHTHLHGVSHTHSEHDKYSMVLACFIVVMVFLLIMIALLSRSTKAQTQMLNNSNMAMDQISNLKKAVVGMKGAQQLGIAPGNIGANLGSRKGGFSNGLRGTDGAYLAGGSFNNIQTPFFGTSDGGSRLAQVNGSGEQIGTGQGLKNIIGGDCANGGACGAIDNLGVYSMGTGGGAMLSSIGGGNSEVASELALFQDVLGTISKDVTIAQNDRANMQTQRANMQAQRANMQSQR
jgi:hypothetical protein